MSPPRLYVVPNGSPPSRHDGSQGELPDKDERLDLAGNSPSQRQKIKATATPRDWQLPLPFDDTPIGPTVLIVPMVTMNGSTLRGLINERRPNSAVDLRELIRFDLPGTSREDVFRTLQVHHTYYVKDPLPWHRLDARALAMLDGPVSNKLVHEIAEQRAACIFVLVYKHDEARSIASHLTKVLSERMVGPWHIEEAV